MKPIALLILSLFTAGCAHAQLIKQIDSVDSKLAPYYQNDIHPDGLYNFTNGGELFQLIIPDNTTNSSDTISGHYKNGALSDLSIAPNPKWPEEQKVSFANGVDECQAVFKFFDSLAICLKNKGIIVPYPLLLAENIVDISTILPLADTITRKIKGDETKIVVNVGPGINFDESPISRYVYPNSGITCYELTLKNKIVSQEKFYFNGGYVLRSYYYENGIPAKITTRSTNPDAHSSVRIFKVLKK